MSPLYTSLIQSNPDFTYNGDMVMDSARFRASQQIAGSMTVRQYTGLCVWSQMDLSVTPDSATSLGQQHNLSEISPVK